MGWGGVGRGREGSGEGGQRGGAAEREGSDGRAGAGGTAGGHHNPPQHHTTPRTQLAAGVAEVSLLG